MNIRVLVVDDEPLARVGITTRLGAYSDMVVVGECGTGEDALTAIPQVSPDLIFVDVEMPGISGLDLLRALPREQARCIVFLTAHEEYALDAFNVEALETQFVRVHRSTIVQVERIVRVEPSANRDAVLTLRDGKTLRVSRTYRSRLDELLHLL
jgi:DNA-binding LytR/AlgR family response regulator